MAGKPFKVGRFAHTLRVRLMREHMGVDVDSIEEDQLMSRPPVADSDDIETWDPDHEQDRGEDGFNAGVTKIKRRTAGERMRRTVESGLAQGGSCFFPFPLVDSPRKWTMHQKEVEYANCQ
jgi:phospholipase D1/2